MFADCRRKPPENERALRGLVQPAIARTADEHAGIDLVKRRAQFVARVAPGLLRRRDRRLDVPAGGIDRLQGGADLLVPYGELARRAGLRPGRAGVVVLDRLDAGI